MTPELGYALTVGALVLALYGAGAAAMSGLKGRADLQRSSERAAIGVWLLITASMLLLVYAFLSFDFSVRYVANNTNRGTPFYYRITALWGALEGSIILWAWMLSLYTLIMVGRYRRTQPQLYPWSRPSAGMGERRSKGGAGIVITRRKKAAMPSITASDHG